ncbi:ankyrin repeat-containing domain protein [Mycena vulgaris]|nr:ankyrin repeat-containing domain protein [Mycena vulgaris]
MKKHIDLLHRFRSIFADYVSANTLILSEASYTKLETFGRERDRSQLMEWLQPPSPPRHGPPTEPPCPGTGKWFLKSDVYVRWRTSAPSILWCHGKPGVGKSILSSIVLRDLQETVGVSVLHYFCDFAAGKQQTSTLILQSLLCQMLLHGNDGHISLLKRARDRFGMTLSSKELSQVLIDMCKMQQPGPYIVLDAMDELEDRKLLLPLLGELVQIGCPIFVTSRYIPDITEVLATSEQVELEANRADLKLFVESELQASDFAHVSATSGIADAIVDQAGGIFLLARLLMNHLLALTTIKEIRQSLASLPPNLTSAYQSSLDRILAQPAPRSALAFRLIAWITHAERRLTTAEILHAFAVEDNVDKIDEEIFTLVHMLLQVCVGLVIVDADSTVSLVHATAHKFFTEMPAQFVNAHDDMANTCLRYLCLQTPFGAGPCDNVLDMETRLHKMPFLAYAAHYWGLHTHHVKQSLTQLIHKLLDNTSLRGSSFQALQHRRRLDPQLAEASFSALPTAQGPLHIVAYWDLGAMAELYLDDKDLSPLDAQGWTPLHWACFRGSSIVRELLLHRGAETNITDSHHWTPLFWASFNGDVEGLRSLLAHGASHLIRDVSSWTALQWAVFSGQQSTVEVLLNHHTHFLATQPILLVASLSVAEAQKHQDAHSMVPAEIAAKTGNTDLLDVLLQDINLGSTRSLGFNEAWKEGRFDPTMTNLWRMMSKDERINGQEAFLRDRIFLKKTWTSTEWRSHLLHTAIRDDKMLMVQLLLELGADANYTVGGRTALHTATFRKDASFIKILLSAGADPTLRDTYGRTALHQAIINGFEETAAALIMGAADVNACILTTNAHANATVRKGPHAGMMTPLMLTCGFLRGNERDVGFPTHIAHLLLAAGADTTPADDSGHTVIHYAVEACDLSLVRLLLAAGADITPVDGSGHTAIHYAIKTCDLSLVKLLLENGAEIPAPKSTGYCAIHTLAEGRSYRQSAEDLQCLLDLLLEQLPAGVESMVWHKPPRDRVEVYPTFGQTPLLLAMRENNWNMVTALLNREAQLQTTEPLEPFLERAISQWHPVAVQFLLNHGANPAKPNGIIMDLISSASRNSNQNYENFALILAELVQGGADIHCVDYQGQPPLMVATSPAIVQALIDAGADPCDTNNDGLDAFMLSALHENVDTLCCLLENTAKISHLGSHWTKLLYPTALDPSQDSIAYICECLKQHNLLGKRTKTSNKTLLQLAVEAGSAHTVAHLIACGVDYEEADTDGWRALHIAIFKSHRAVVDVLLTAGADVHAMTKKWQSPNHKPSGLYQGDGWTGQALHLAAMTGDAHIVAELLARGVDVHARTYYTLFQRDVTALHIVLDTGTFYGRKGTALDRGRLEIAAMLIEHGAEVQGAVDLLYLKDVLLFEDFEDVWDRLRAGVTDRGARLK